MYLVNIPVKNILRKLTVAVRMVIWYWDRKVPMETVFGANIGKVPNQRPIQRDYP